MRRSPDAGPRTKGLRPGERVELRDAFRVGGREPVLLLDASHVVRAPDEVGGAVDRRHEVGRHDDGALVVLVRPQLEGVEVPAPLAGGVDDGGVLGVQRALGERRERADLLDLVSEELDAQRLAAGRREDVDEPAAHGELATLVDPVDPLVAGEREMLGEPVDARLVADADRQRLRPGRTGRQPLRERASGGADETPGREHVESAIALADEVRRRLEPRLPADPTAREQRHGRVPREPRGGLGRVAGVGVVGQ